ncbi:MAG: hypothetical protein HY355_03110 [Armatimonadetes bacterium]|nr:hypothetical protein [Armatimonadota bacterium]
MPSGQDLRHLLQLRGRIREAIVHLPRAGQREVLRAMEQARHARLYGRETPWTPPEMTSAELVREIKWRLDAASLAEVQAGVNAIARARRAALPRARRMAARRVRP